MNQLVTLGGRIRKVRTDRGMSQAEFGDIAGVTKKTQMLYEKGERSPGAEYLSAIGAAGIDLNFILTGDEGTDRVSLMEKVSQEADGGQDGPLTKLLYKALLKENEILQRRRSELIDLERLVLAFSDEDFDLIMRLAVNTYKASLLNLKNEKRKTETEKGEKQ